MDLKTLSFNIDPPRVVECLNKIISAFDKIGDNYDVFKVETKADASYMVVAGLKDRSHITSSRTPSPTVTKKKYLFFNNINLLFNRNISDILRS